MRRSERNKKRDGKSVGYRIIEKKKRNKMGAKQELEEEKSHILPLKSSKVTGNIYAYVCLILKKFTSFISSAKQSEPVKYGVLKNSFAPIPIISISFSVTQQPKSGLVHLTVEVSIPHTIRHTNTRARLEGILQTSEQHVAEVPTQ